MATEFEVVNMLERAHPAPAWAFFRGVANGTGAKGTRTADAMAMSLYPSRGLHLWGFEVKTDRGDWLRELKDPDKAEAIARYCDHWVIAASKDVVLPGEVPGKWGWAEVTDKVRWKKPAERLEPMQMDRVFLAALLRRAAERIEQSVPKEEINERVEKRYQEWQKDQAERDARHEKDMQDEIVDLRKKMQDFSQASGVSLYETWNFGNIGAAVQAVMDAKYTGLSFKLEREAESLKHIAEQAAEAAKQVREAIQKMADKQQGVLPLTNKEDGV